MNDFAEGLLSGGMTGFLVGLIVSFILLSYTDTDYIHKTTLEKKKTINMIDCYAQYSAVRRFPK